MLSPATSGVFAIKRGGRHNAVYGNKAIPPGSTTADGASPPILKLQQFQLDLVWPGMHIEKRLISRVRFIGGFHRHVQVTWLAMVISSSNQPQMSTEVRNWDVVAKAMEAAGATSSEMYIRAKALALGKLDPMPTSSPEAPYSISAVAG